MRLWAPALSSVLCLVVKAESVITSEIFPPISWWWVLMRTKQLSMAAPGGTGGVEEVIWLYACVTWSAHTALFGAVCFLPDISTKTFLIARMVHYNLTTKEWNQMVKMLPPVWLSIHLQVKSTIHKYEPPVECIFFFMNLDAIYLGLCHVAWGFLWSILGYMRAPPSSSLLWYWL